MPRRPILLDAAELRRLTRMSMIRGHVLRLAIGIAVGATMGAALGYYGRCTSGTCPLTATPWRGAIYGAILGALFTLSTVRGGAPPS